MVKRVSAKDGGASSRSRAVNAVANPKGGYAVAQARTIFFPYWINSSGGGEYANVPAKTGIGAGIGRLYITGHLRGPFFKLIFSAVVGANRAYLRIPFTQVKLVWWGLFHGMADGLKLLLKEDITIRQLVAKRLANASVSLVDNCMR